MEFERVILKAIYEQGIKLPDSAQELIPQANCKPDFIYRKAKIVIFCNGSVNDSAEQQQRDRIQRENLFWHCSYQITELNYKEDWQSKLRCIIF